MHSFIQRSSSERAGVFVPLTGFLKKVAPEYILSLRCDIKDDILDICILQICMFLT